MTGSFFAYISLTKQWEYDIIYTVCIPYRLDEIRLDEQVYLFGEVRNERVN